MKGDLFRKHFLHLLLFLLILCTLTLVVISKSVKDKDCENDNKSETLEGDHLLNNLATKKPYNPLFIKDESWKPFPSCKAIKFWYFGRHGTRNPGKKDIAKMRSLLPGLRDAILDSSCKGQLSKSQVKLLKNWELKKSLALPGYDSYLVSQGEKELKGIGSRWRKRFPHLFTPEKLELKSTKSQRTEASAIEFASGLLDLKYIIPSSLNFETPGKSNSILKFYESCGKWTSEVDENANSTLEVTNFDNSNIIKATISKLSGKLGFNLTLDEVELIYTTCAFETAWTDGKKASPWCAGFDLEDLQAVAYREDLDYYWKDGYGYDINYQQACPAVGNLLEFFKDTTTTPASRASFTHSGATLKLLARLGLFKDEQPLRALSFPEVRDTYKWRSSIIDSMASNLAFVLYSCGDDAKEPVVGFFFQEKPTNLPACGGTWFCPLSKLSTSLAEAIGSCEIDKICKL